jgi:hypothetical protein
VAEPVHQRAHQEPGEVDRAQQVDQADGLQRHPALQQDRGEGGEEERVTDVGDEEQRADDREAATACRSPSNFDLPEHERPPSATDRQSPYWERLSLNKHQLISLLGAVPPVAVLRCPRDH